MFWPRFTISIASAGMLANVGAAQLAQELEAQVPPATSSDAASVLDSTIEAEQVSEPQAVDLVICLDTSGSMSGLIDAAKQKLWAIVNDLALAKPTPVLRVALLTYGNDGNDSEVGWVNVESGFTDDLDLISERLFVLTTNGGTEYVGRVIQASVAQLDWSPSADALKLIVVAGNETADQDQVAPYRDMCREAIGRGIMINAIYCGSPTDNIAPSWREVAQLADGHFASIDQNNGTIVVSTPFDDRLAELGSTLNTTYIAYGASGEQGQMRQTAMDANARSMNTANAASRAAAKGGKMYRNHTWDLVDASLKEDFDLAEIPEEDLPENMQAMSLEERGQYLDEKIAARKAIQEQIADLDGQRQQFIVDKMRQQGLDDAESFDAAIRGAIRRQAAGKGFAFPPDETDAQTVSDVPPVNEEPDAES